MSDNKTQGYAVTCYDGGDSCDGRPRFLGFFTTREEAKKFVSDDMLRYWEQGFEIDTNEMLAKSDSDHWCSWNIEKVEIGIDT